MAQQVQVLLTDDLDGGEADETIQFSLDGTLYEIDLSTANAAQFRKDTGPWVDHARKAGSQATANGAPKRRRRGDRTRSADIRTWAREQGYEVSDFGRISPAIVAGYDETHQ